VRIYVLKRVVEEVADPLTEISLAEARSIDPNAELGQVLEIETAPPRDFGRIAAQTAKQVVLQRIREAERDLIYEAFTDREGDVVTGVIQRIEPKAAIIDLGKAEATLPITEQVPTEHYRVGQRLKVYVVEVNRTPRGPQIVVSRTHRGLVRRLFELEVPEIYSGVVEMKSIAREPGSRTKVAVMARQEGVDPIGSCVGVRGVRIQNVVNELNGEKIDVVQWSPDPATFVENALSPAAVISVRLNEAEKTATATVPERQLSLAIGREGQNARLAAKLTGWRIDIKAASLPRAEGAAPALSREESLARLQGSGTE
jgi:N utilization substance protein A